VHAAVSASSSRTLTTVLMCGTVPVVCLHEPGDALSDTADDLGPRDDATRRVVLVDFPLRVARRAYVHREAIIREFAIIALGGGEQADIPKRLLEIATVLDERYSGINPEAEDEIDAAAARGDDRIDLVLHVPRRIGQDTLDVAPLLVEVDAYCRSGDLLTLAPTEETRAFWIWFLLEFVRQADGEPPLSWREFTRANG